MAPPERNAGNADTPPSPVYRIAGSGML